MRHWVIGFLVLGCSLGLVLHVSTHRAEAASTGTIQGKILFTGKAPSNPRIVMAADRDCMKLNQGRTVYQEEVAVNANGTLKNVFVHIAEGLKTKNYPPPKDPVLLDQKQCLFHPRVLGAMVGQILLARNSDPTLHNIRLSSKAGNAFNIAQPVQGMETPMKLKAPEVMIRAQCDVHNWMRAWIGVVPHPYFAVTGEDGTFTLKNVPPGTYTLQAWQEKYGALQQKVTVKPGAAVTVNFTYTGTEKAELNPGFVIQDLVLDGSLTRVRLGSAR